MGVRHVAIFTLLLGLATGSRNLCSGKGRCHEELSRRALQQITAPRIVGGTAASEGRFPYMVSIMNSDGVHFCGGILIDKKWVLSAAHCFERTRRPIVSIGALYVRGDKDSEAEEMQVEEVILHENFERAEEGFDIALVKLPKNAKAKVFAELAEEDELLETSHVVYAMGWGRTSPSDPTSDVLQFVRLEALANKNCQRNHDKFPRPATILDSMMCTFSRGADTCSGDSGGPLIMANTKRGNVEKGLPERDVIHGITSFGDKDCESFKLAGVYTRVGAFRGWITSIIGSGSAPSGKPAAPAPSLNKEDDCPNYTVKSGDICFNLWVANGLTEKQFRDANPQLNAACALQVGQQLCIPSNKSASCRKSHVADIGDTCFGLAQANDLTAEEFTELNPSMDIGSSCTIFPGQEICLA